MDGRGSCSAVSDSTGNLLFYCFNKTGINDSTTFVYNYLNDTIVNGNDLYGQGAFNQIVIIPKPDDFNNYYIFYNGIFDTQGFYYALVNMNLNGGQGEVTQKNTPLIPNTRMADCVKAIKHGNGRDWWVVVKLSSTNLTQINRFFVYLVSPSGIASPIVQDFGGATDGDFQRLVFNSDGSSVMLVNTGGLMCQFKFDRCTGILSNPNIIFPEQSANFNRLFWEGAYSPNDSIFYVSTTWYSGLDDTSRLLQYELFAADIPASCDTLLVTKNPVIAGAPRLAPDNKIYYSSLYQWGFPGYPYPDSVYNQYNMNLGVVNSPNDTGSACDFQPFSFHLGGKRTYSGLPNNPNYLLGPLAGSACDTLYTKVNEIKTQEIFDIFPNPFTSKIVLRINEDRNEVFYLKIVDTFGKIIFEIKSFKKNLELDMSFLPNGVYLVQLNSENIVTSKKIIKI